MSCWPSYWRRPGDVARYARRVARTHGRIIEVESLTAFDGLIEAGAASMLGWRIQDVDLTERTDALLALDPQGSLLLGCTVSNRADEHLRRGGALIFPEIAGLPFDPYRASLYSPAELYDGLMERRYESTPDAQCYAWSRSHRHDVAQTLAAALHDHAVDDALEEALVGTSSVGVMGGHGLRRDESAYREAVALGRALARAGHHVVTGGGPGAMEAANLGAFVSTRSEGSVDAILQELAAVPDFRPSITRWARAAFSARAEVEADGEGVPSLGIPTWFYGHEPPNLFATSIAKYFQNALREDTLLRHCGAGIVFLPGAAGTVQEIFQDACENFYSDAATVIPMVLVGFEHWTHEVPAWPLLSRLAQGRAMQDAVHLVDSVTDVVSALGG